MKHFDELTPEDQCNRLRELARKSLANWNLEGSEISLIKYRENAVYEVSAPDGRRYALRIHRHGYHSDASLRSELEWMAALSERGIPVPEVIPATNGHMLVSEVTDSIAEPRRIDLFAWIHGEPLGSVEYGLGENAEQVSELYGALGAVAARLHNQSNSWTPPEGFERHAWDTDGLVGDEPFWGRFWELELLDESQKRLMRRVRDVLAEELNEYDRSSERFGLIHADFVPENLMTENGSLRLIDFDDSGFGWHMFELATALYFIQEERCYTVAKQALIAGYRAERPLSEEDLGRLELFLTARGCTYLGWIRSRQETDTAQEMAPELIRRACEQAERFLNGKSIS